MLEKIQTELLGFWQGMQPRERIVLTGGILLVCGLVFYLLILKPWHRALTNMTMSVANKRIDLVWMQQQAELLQSGGIQVREEIRGSNRSLMAVVEQSAKSAGIDKAIQQMVPRANNTEVSMVFEDVSFNKWLRWADDLHRNYGVQIKQMTADRESEKPDTAEIRLTLSR